LHSGGISIKKRRIIEGIARKERKHPEGYNALKKEKGNGQREEKGLIKTLVSLTPVGQSLFSKRK